jgi:pyridoxal phosphate enzyme (YggS family)
MSSVAERLSSVRERIHRAALSASRDPASVRLVAVSKFHPASAIREAYAAGQRDFGENYVQELASKADELADLTDLRFHFIGHLQSNKARVVVRMVDVVHTVDSAALARELAKRVGALGTGKRLSVLIEVNVGGEEQKHGIPPGELTSMVDAIESESTLVLSGLMTMPPNDPERARAAFVALRALQTAHGGSARLPELSKTVRRWFGSERRYSVAAPNRSSLAFGGVRHPQDEMPRHFPPARDSSFFSQPSNPEHSVLNFWRPAASTTSGPCSVLR